MDVDNPARFPNREMTHPLPDPTSQAAPPAEPRKRDYDERTSLHPLTFDQALRGLLAVKTAEESADTENSVSGDE